MASASQKLNEKQWVKLDSLNFSKREIIKILNSGSVLDLGCGDGLLLEQIKESRTDDILGLDFSHRAIELATDRGVPAQVFDLTQALPLADNSFDNILLIDVLEHFFQPEELLIEAARVTNNYVYISVPNFSSLPARWQVLRGKVPENNTPRDGHVFWFNRKKIMSLVALAGLEVELESVNTFWQNKVIIGTIMARLAKWRPSLFALSFIIKAKKISMSKPVSKEELVDYYDNIYKGRDTLRPMSEYEEKLSFLGEVKEGQSLLDVGCGTGYFLKAAVAKGLKVAGLEISPQAAKLAKEFVPQADIVLGEGEHLPFSDNSFDYTVSLGSLEHFFDVEGALDEMIRVTKAGGKLLLMVPNKNYIFWKITGEDGTGQIKELLLSYPDWKKMFNQHGLSIEKVFTDKYPATSVKIFVGGPLKVLRRLIYRAIWLVLPRRWTYQFAFVCRKS